jgi:purine-binding chemotaxis protein CheW
MSNITPIRPERGPTLSTTKPEFLTFSVAGQHFAIPATSVQDVLRLPPLTQVPLARPEIIGLLNLRGHIVTAISLSIRLGNAPAKETKPMAVVIHHAGEPACLVVDAVGDVVALAPEDMESNPASMNGGWSALSRGIFKMPAGLLVVLDVENVLNFKNA